MDVRQILLGQKLRRAYHTANYFDKKMFIFGGYSEMPKEGVHVTTSALSSVELSDGSEFEVVNEYNIIGKPECKL